MINKIKQFIKKHKVWVYIGLTVLAIVFVTFIENNNAKLANEPKFNVKETNEQKSNNNASFFSPEKLEQTVIPGNSNLSTIKESLGQPKKVAYRDNGLVVSNFDFPNSLTGVLVVTSASNGDIKHYSYSLTSRELESSYIKKYALGEPDIVIEPSGDDKTIIQKVYLSKGISLTVMGSGESTFVMDFEKFIPTDKEQYLDSYKLGTYSVR